MIVRMTTAEQTGYATLTPPPARLERARGAVRIGVRAGDSRTRLSVLYQSGSARMRLPRVAAGEPIEAVIINTAGGVTGGDRIDHEISVGDSARLLVTTQAAERIYRRSTGVSRIETTISVAAGGRLDWLPQETIVFDRSALCRRLVADVEPSATLLAAEAVVLGRAAMGESVRTVSILDSWRIRRGGRLVFADGVRFDGDAAAIMDGRATGGGASAFATLVLVSPEAETLIDKARAALDNLAGEGGASAWNGMLVARLIARSGQALRADLIRLVETLRGAVMSRVWHC
jgi:urease accessory protein